MNEHRALFATSNFWYSPYQVGSHQMARCLSNMGWKVAFVSAPISPLHLLGGKFDLLKQRFELYRSGGKNDLGGNLWAYVSGAFFTPNDMPFLRSQWVQENWHRFSIPPIETRLRQEGFNNVDVIMIDFIDHACWIKDIQAECLVYRLADNNLGYRQFTKAQAMAERSVAARADLVIYTASNLKGYANNLYARRSLHLPNGVNFDHFRRMMPVPEDLRNIAHPIALYVGAMEDWFDFKLLEDAARTLPHVSFVLIGSAHLAKEKLKPTPNIHVLGARPFQAIPAYMQHSDVGIIPFDVSKYRELVNSIHPLKLYEYMASGLPVVAVEWEELRSINSPAILAKNEKEFIEGIKVSLTGSGWDREKLIEFAHKHDWSERVNELLSALV